MTTVNLLLFGVNKNKILIFFILNNNRYNAHLFEGIVLDFTTAYKFDKY